MPTTLSGSAKALMYSQFGPMRFGATRFGYHSPFVYISIAGTLRRDQTLAETLTITDTLDEVPNRCQFTVRGFTPTVGMEVIITLGSSNNAERLFAGYILHVQQVQQGKDLAVLYHVDCIDYTWLLTFRRVTKQYRTQSASAIAVDLIASYAPGFTAAHVESGLDVVDEITFTNEDLPTCLTRLAKRGGAYWRPDYVKDVHFGITDDAANPVDLTTTHPTVAGLAYDRDLSQILTRVLVEGYGSQAGAAVDVGGTEIPVLDPVGFNAAGGTFVSGPQRITYTGLVDQLIHNPTWTSRTNPGSQWTSVTWAPAVGLFVAVGGSAVATSADGITWTARTAAAAVGWQYVTWAPALSLFVAVANSGTAAQQVMTSPDGITWTSRTAPSANLWESVVWAPTVGLFVAVSRDGANRVMTSPDGITWTARSAAAASTWWSVTWAPALSLFVAVASTGATQVMTSPDGITWTARTAAAANQWLAVTWAPALNLFAAVSFDGASRVMTSPDGITWTSRTAAAANQWWAITWSPEEARFVAFALDVANRIMTSPDGITWTGESAGSASPLTIGGLTWAPALSRYVLVTNATVLTNETAIGLKLLTGIPSSGLGSIQYAIAEGDDLNILVTVNDLAAQTALATLLGTGDGVVEEYLQDRRLSETECTARGRAILDLRSPVEGRLHYRCRDKRSRSGLTITISIAGTTNITGAFKIQQVTISDFGHRVATCYPTFEVQASTTRFSFEDLLRQVRKAAA